MAIINNVLGFSLKKTLNEIIVERLNTDETITMTATLFVQKNCSNNSFKQITGNEELDQFVTFKTPKEDGTYKIKIGVTNLNEEYQFKEYSFTSYNNLLQSFIKDSQKLLCNLNCNDCDNGEDLKDLQARLILNMMSFYILNKHYYSKFFNLGLDCIKCELLNILNCNRTNVSFYGKKEDDVIYKKLVGYLYLIFYFGEKYTYTCCPEQVDKFFKSDMILNCLADINIDISCIETKIISDENFSISDGNFIELN